MENRRKIGPGPLRRGGDFRHFALFLTSELVSSTLKLCQNDRKRSLVTAVTLGSGQKIVKKSPLYCFGSHGVFRGTFYVGFEKLDLRNFENPLQRRPK